MGRTSLRSAGNLPHRQWTDLTVERYRDYEGRHGLFQEDQIPCLLVLHGQANLLTTPLLLPSDGWRQRAWRM